jgi:hypothetical protein
MGPPYGNFSPTARPGAFQSKHPSPDGDRRQDDEDEQQDVPDFDVHGHHGA